MFFMLMRFVCGKAVGRIQPQRCVVSMRNEKKREKKKKERHKFSPGDSQVGSCLALRMRWVSVVFVGCFF